MPAIVLKKAPGHRAIAETQMRYDVYLHGQYFGELYYNLRGYVGYLPTPEGHSLDIGEKAISRFKQEIARLNREFAARPT